MNLNKNFNDKLKFEINTLKCDKLNLKLRFCCLSLNNFKFVIAL